MELEEDKKPNRFWTKYINKPNNQNVPVPISVKIEYAKQRIRERGNKRVERFNLTHKLQQFNVGESILLKANPVGKRSDNTAKKFFRLYNGPYTLRQRVGQNTFIVYDEIPVSYTHLDVYKRQVLSSVFPTLLVSATLIFQHESFVTCA